MPNLTPTAALVTIEHDNANGLVWVLGTDPFTGFGVCEAFESLRGAEDFVSAKWPLLSVTYRRGVNRR